jgi:hypothetical protein
MLNSHGLSVIAGPREPIPAAYPMAMVLLFQAAFSLAAATPKSSGK